MKRIWAELSKAKVFRMAIDLERKHYMVNVLSKEYWTKNEISLSLKYLVLDCWNTFQMTFTRILPVV